MGAIAAGGVRVLDWTTIAGPGNRTGDIDDVAGREARELVASGASIPRATSTSPNDRTNGHAGR